MLRLSALLVFNKSATRVAEVTKDESRSGAMLLMKDLVSSKVELIFGF